MSAKKLTAIHLITTVTQTIVSLAVLFFSMYILLDKNQDDSAKKWASGVIGTILGYWLK